MQMFDNSQTINRIFFTVDNLTLRDLIRFIGSVNQDFLKSLKQLQTYLYYLMTVVYAVTMMNNVTKHFQHK